MFKFCSSAIIAYRVFRNDSKRLVKILHAVMQFGALGFSSFALASVFSAHNEGGIANLYSIHSWLGLATFVMFALQVMSIVRLSNKQTWVQVMVVKSSSSLLLTL